MKKINQQVMSLCNKYVLFLLTKINHNDIVIAEALPTAGAAQSTYYYAEEKLKRGVSCGQSKQSIGKS